MWFHPLKQMVGNIVNYDENEESVNDPNFNRESHDVLKAPFAGKPSASPTLYSG